MSKTIEYQGISYTVSEDTTLDDMLKNEKFMEIHEQNMLQKTREIVAPTPQEQRLLDREANKSGILDALLQGMSNDPADRDWETV